MRRPPLTLAALILLLLGSLAAPPSAAARARLQGIPAEVRGGDRIEIRWSGLDADVDEVELELSLGGARWVRISPEMEVLEGRYTWRVPEGLAGPARIRLRAGGERGEREVAEHELRITSAGASGPGASLVTPGWWDLEADHEPATPGLLGHHAPGLFAGIACAEAITTPVPSGERIAGTLRASSRTADAPPAPHVCRRSFVAPRQSPLRI